MRGTDWPKLQLELSQHHSWPWRHFPVLGIHLASVCFLLLFLHQPAAIYHQHRLLLSKPKVLRLDLPTGQLPPRRLKLENLPYQSDITKAGLVVTKHRRELQHPSG